LLLLFLVLFFLLSIFDFWRAFFVSQDTPPERARDDDQTSSKNEVKQVPPKNSDIITPPLESPSSQTANNGRSLVDKMIELCVNKDAAAGLDVAALVNKLRVQDLHLENLNADLSSERQTNEALRIRLQQMERSEIGTVLLENENLKQSLKNVTEEREEARALLESIREEAMKQSFSVGPVAIQVCVGNEL
jgi:hypothetical protein